MRAMRLAGFMAVVACLMASDSGASPVFPHNSTVPTALRLVGSSAAGADPAGSFTVVARDLANNPNPGVSLVIDFSRCPDFKLCPEQLDPSMTVDCAAKTVSKLTDALGTATFIVLGSSNGSAQPSTLISRALVYGTGVLLGSPVVSAFDLDGSSGVGVNDLAVWLGDLGSLEPRGRSDFDGSGVIGINDLSVWLEVLGARASSAGCASTCQ